jgi:TBC domain-containing protein kinase-like protein
LNLSIFEDFLKKDAEEMEDKLYKNVISRKMDELYYLWQLAGGDISIELKKQGLIRSRPPVLSIPK